MKQKNYIEDVSILGRNIRLTPIDSTVTKGLSVGDRLSYSYYSSAFGGEALAFAIPKGSLAPPRALAVTSQNVSQKLKMPLVFVLPGCPAYLRQRLIDKRVYFIVSDKFAFLPNLLVNERQYDSKQIRRLSPVAQYILLYHLQVKSLNGMSALDLPDLIPYSYPSIALGLACLEGLGLAERRKDGKAKRIYFLANGRDLFESAKQFMVDPVAKRTYCDELNAELQGPVCGINALAHYTHINPDSVRMLAVSEQMFKELAASKAFVGANGYDGNVMIEVWKYPPVSPSGYRADWVDKLSLALSLANDEDPRVENESQRLIDEMEWSD